VSPNFVQLAAIDDLSARAAFADFVGTYALNIRSGNGAGSAGLFTKDAAFEIKEALLGPRGPARPRTKLAGRAAISNTLLGAAGAQTRVCPMIHNLFVRVNGAEAPTARPRPGSFNL